MELLAPAGNMEQAISSINAGCDALYGGVEKWNARINAKNFTIETIVRADRLVKLNINTVATKVAALARELKEEININIDAEQCAFYQAVSVEFEEYIINLDTFIVRYTGEELQLNVHQESKWINIEDLLKYKWCDTDYIIVNNIVRDGGIKGVVI